MTFTSLELSKKLVALGCVSKSGFVYDLDFIRDPRMPEPEEFSLINYGPPDYYKIPLHNMPAFCLEDFVGTHEQAKENVRLLFEDPWSTKRYEMIDSEDWCVYLEKAVEGK